jgi:hypothetical protein
MGRRIAGFLFVAASAFGQTVTPIVPITLTASSNLPPIGLAVTETAQVNVFATAAAPSGAAAASCGGTIAFYDAQGTVIGTASSFTVGSGQIFSVALPYASAGGSGSRIVVRAVIMNRETIAGFSVPPCALSYSLETYDTSTGVTHAFVSGVVTQYAVASGTLQGVVPVPPH